MGTRQEGSGENYIIRSFTIFTRYDSGDKIEKNEMGGEYNTYGVRRCVYGVLEGKPERKRPLGRPRRRWDDNIKMDLQEVRWRAWTRFIWLRRGTGSGHL